MNKLTIYPIAVLFIWMIGANTNLAQTQFDVKMNVLSGTSTTTCTDPIGQPDPQWAVNINGAGWVVYPSNIFCYTNFPNEQFSASYTCFSDVPAAIPVCFRAFENDASIFDPCTPVFSCAAEICINVPVPPTGTVPFNITLPAGGQSGGSVNMNIAVSGVPGGISDMICNAIPLGVLQTGVPVGIPDSSVFNNFCSTNLNEPDPSGIGGWYNNEGVWFSFTTDSNPSDVIYVVANSDPSNFNDPINIQMAVFKSDDNTCTGNFTYVTQAHNPGTFDEQMVFSCPEPNTTYYVVIDGVYTTPGDNSQLVGWFSLQATQLDVLAGAELRCEAEDLGAVPLGGSISSGQRTNACSLNSNAAPATGFTVQQSVWFAFTPPPTGHVYLQATSSTIDPISLQLGVYTSSDGTCTGVFSEVASQFTNNQNDELIELNCLDPNETYYVMVDGSTNALVAGIFTLTMTDAGNETPTTNLNPVLCFGETFTVGNNDYGQTGIYFDTLQLAGGCDSIVITNLTVLSELQLDVQVLNQGIGLGNTTGQLQASASGGAGNYVFNWSDGQTGQIASNAIGGDNYCVTVTDGNGCQLDTCLVMPYFVNFIPSGTGSSLDCHGDLDGTLEFTAIGGVAPYIFDWENQDNAVVSGAGTIPFDGQVIALSGLPGGTYSIHLSDIAFDTTIFVEIFEPTALTANITNTTNATCFGGCNGSVTLSVAGGTPPYQVAWSNGTVGNAATALCAGNYEATVTDANGCSTAVQAEITEPVVFTAIANEAQTVSCFQGTDGIANVTTSEPAQSYIWSNGETTASISGLVGGIYTVTATNPVGCTVSATVVVSTPSAPVSVGITESQGIICQGDASGELVATASGPGSNFTYVWSNGESQSTATGLAAGNYSLTVSNEKGCSASASASLTEPTEIQSTFTTNKIGCLDPAFSGAISVEQTIGGYGPYTYSLDGIDFQTDTVLVGYPAGLNSFYVLDEGGCVKEFQTTIEGPEVLLIDLGNDEDIDLGDSIQLSVSASQIGLSYTWSPAESLSCADCPNPIATPFTSIEYSLVATTADGCTATDNIQVNVRNNQDVYIPNAFSPNGDGLNDEFMPYTGGAVTNIKAFRIFDRQGNQVFGAKNMLQNQSGTGWNGEFRGKQMQPGVFVWLAEIEFLDGKVQTYKGDVLLVK